MVGGDRGIDDWYLDREGRRGSRHGDDDQPDRGPDAWLDRVTGPAAARGRRATPDGARRSARASGQASGHSRQPATPTARSTPSARTGQRPPAGTDLSALGEAPRRGWKAVETPVSRKSSPRSPATETRPAPASATDQELVREVVEMQDQAAQSLSYAEVIRRLHEAGQTVTKADLQRAMKVTNTPWGKTSKKAKAARRPSAASDKSKKSPRMAGQSPKPKIVDAVRQLRAARPGMSAGEMAHRLRATGFQVAEAEVVAAIQAVQLGGRRKSSPTAFDRAVAREASLLSARSTRTLSLDEVVGQLRAAGRTVTVADLDYALLVTNTRLSEPSAVPPRDSGAVRRAASRAVPRRAADVASDAKVCQACGVPISANGYCGCS